MSVALFGAIENIAGKNNYNVSKIISQMKLI